MIVPLVDLCALVLPQQVYADVAAVGEATPFSPQLTSKASSEPQLSSQKTSPHTPSSLQHALKYRLPQELQERVRSIHHMTVDGAIISGSLEWFQRLIAADAPDWSRCLLVAIQYQQRHIVEYCLEHVTSFTYGHMAAAAVTNNTSIIDDLLDAAPLIVTEGFLHRVDFVNNMDTVWTGSQADLSCLLFHLARAGHTDTAAQYCRRLLQDPDAFPLDMINVVAAAESGRCDQMITALSRVDTLEAPTMRILYIEAVKNGYGAVADVLEDVLKDLSAWDNSTVAAAAVEAHLQGHCLLAGYVAAESSNIGEISTYVAQRLVDLGYPIINTTMIAVIIVAAAGSELKKRDRAIAVGAPLGRWGQRAVCIRNKPDTSGTRLAAWVLKAGLWLGRKFGWAR